ncbi:MAG: replicative DNA helicase, partial [Bacilli bacterium]
MADEKNPQTDIIEEITILGDILSDETGNTFLDVSPQLNPDDFLDMRNRLIYKTMLTMNSKGEIATVATLTSELQNLKIFDQVGGMDYLSHIISNSFTAAPINVLIRNLLDKSLLNKFLDQISVISNDAKSKPINDIDEFIGNAETSILKITQKRRVADARRIDEVSAEVVSNLVKQTDDFKKEGKRANGVTGLETGYGEMDMLTKGWHKGDMIIVGARPSVGKTSFGLNLLYQEAKRGIPVIFFSLEMSATSIAMRLLEMASRLDHDEINSMTFLHGSTNKQILVDRSDSATTEAQVNNLQQGLNELSALPFYIDDNPGSKMIDISAKCKKLINSIKNVGLIAIDYLGLITSPSKSSSDNRQQEVSDISRQIKSLARTLNVPIIALSQLSRQSEKRDDHRPQLADLRDSGAIEQDADMIFMLYRADYYKSGDEKGDPSASNGGEPDNNSPVSNVTVSLLKNRNGSVGDISFSFDKPHCTFNAVDNTHSDD